MVNKADYLPTPEEIAQHTARFRRKRLARKRAESPRHGRPRRGVVAYRLSYNKTDGPVFDIINS